MLRSAARCVAPPAGRDGHDGAAALCGPALTTLTARAWRRDGAAPGAGARPAAPPSWPTGGIAGLAGTQADCRLRRQQRDHGWGTPMAYLCRQVPLSDQHRQSAWSA
jgi:hypothetical protein